MRQTANGVGGQDPDIAAVRPRIAEADFDALVARHHHAVFSYLHRRTFGDTQLAEDLTQETFMRALQHPEILSSPKGTPLPWLYRVARNLVIDHLRARRVRPAEVRNSDPDALTEEHELGNEIDRLLNTWSVRQAMRELSERHRRVLVEVYFNGRSVSETADLLAVPEGTVKSRCYYGLRSLLLTLREHGTMC